MFENIFPNTGKKCIKAFGSVISRDHNYYFQA